MYIHVNFYISLLCGPCTFFRVSIPVLVLISWSGESCLPVNLCTQEFLFSIAESVCPAQGLHTIPDISEPGLPEVSVLGQQMPTALSQQAWSELQGHLCNPETNLQCPVRNLTEVFLKFKLMTACLPCFLN